MAPRKRRGRSSGHPVSAAPTPASGSNSNSAATCSPSSQPISKSDNESIPDRIASDVPRPPRKPALCDVVDLPPHANQLGRSAPAAATAPPHHSQQTALHSQLLLNALKDGQHLLKDSDAQNDHFTIASVAMEVYNDMINWAIMEVAVQLKHHAYLDAEAARRVTVFQKHAAKHDAKSSKPSHRNDALRVAKIAPTKYGSRLLYSDKNVTVECSNCASNISASRYAQHVEKCLGRGGRMSSRAASARLRASAERAEKEAAADMDELPTRRRRHASSSAANHDFADAPHPSGKRRKMSPVPSAPISQAASMQHGRAGLPPSGRTRASPH